MRMVVSFHVICLVEGITPLLELFHALFLAKAMLERKGWCYLSARRKFLDGYPNSIKDWKPSFFFLGSDGWEADEALEFEFPVQRHWGTVVTKKHEASPEILEEKDLILRTPFVHVGSLLSSCLYDLYFWSNLSMPVLTLKTQNALARMAAKGVKKSEGLS